MVMMGGRGPWVERFVITVTYSLVRLFIRWVGSVRITGKENVPPGGGVLYLSNHISALDVFIIPYAIYSEQPQVVLRQISKEEVLKIPVVGWWLTKLRAFPIKRGKADIGGIRAVENFIRADQVIIYPEGTRSKDGKLGPGNRMVGKFIRSARPVVIPMALKGTNRVVPVGKTIPRRGVDIEVSFGPPLILDEELAIENVRESSVRIIEKAMKGIASLLGEGVSAAAGPSKPAAGPSNAAEDQAKVGEAKA